VSGAERKLLGRWGEMKAAEELRRRGYRVVAAGWHCRFGEIDLIAEDEKYISFTEVKLRKNADFAQAREFVDKRKQEKVRISAQIYLAEHPTHLQPRFDVIEIYAPEGTQTLHPQIHYLTDAF